MKRKIITLAVAFVLIANSMFAGAVKSMVPESVSYAFNQGFAHAKLIHWDSFGTYFKATFMQKGQTMYAFYSDNADFMGVAKNVLSDNLPTTLLSEIKTKFQGYWITDLANYEVGVKTDSLLRLNTPMKSLSSKVWTVSIGRSIAEKPRYNQTVVV